MQPPIHKETLVLLEELETKLINYNNNEIQLFQDLLSDRKVIMSVLETIKDKIHIYGKI